MWEEDVGNCYSDVVLMEIESPSEYFVRYFLLIYFFSLGRAIACASWSNWERIQYYARNSSKFNGTTRVLWIYVLITTGNICIYWKYLWSRPHVGFSIKFTIIWALFFFDINSSLLWKAQISISLQNCSTATGFHSALHLLQVLTSFVPT